jgi:hypothetical protein
MSDENLNNGTSAGDDNNDEQLDNEEMQRRLHAYQQAIREEYETSLEDKTVDPDLLQESTDTFFRKNVPLAAAQIAWLSQNSTNDSTRFVAAKYIVERGLKSIKTPDDDLSKLLEKIKST